MLILVCVFSLLVGIAAPDHNADASRAGQVETATTTTSLTTTVSQPHQLISSAFKVISTHGTTLRCVFWDFSFVGSQGQYVYANFTSDIPLDFYVVQDTTYQYWLKQGSCGSASNALGSQAHSMSYDFSSILPNSGTWTIVLVNLSSSRDADGFITVSLSSPSYTVTQTMVSTVTLTGTTSSSTTLSVGPSSSPAPEIAGFPFESITIGLVVGLGVLVILRHRRH